MSHRKISTYLGIEYEDKVGEKHLATLPEWSIIELIWDSNENKFDIIIKSLWEKEDPSELAFDKQFCDYNIILKYEAWEIHSISVDKSLLFLDKNENWFPLRSPSVRAQDPWLWETPIKTDIPLQPIL